MQRVELVFGLSRKGRPDVTQAEWVAFLDREVTPRFPDGLTVLEAQGRWRNAAGVGVTEASRLLLVWVKPEASLGRRIDDIRDAWKVGQNQESVLRVQRQDCVSF